jgi:hypothetical protein
LRRARQQGSLTSAPDVFEGRCAKRMMLAARGVTMQRVRSLSGVANPPGWCVSIGSQRWLLLLRRSSSWVGNASVSRKNCKATLLNTFAYCCTYARAAARPWGSVRRVVGGTRALDRIGSAHSFLLRRPATQDGRGSNQGSRPRHQTKRRPFTGGAYR